jgi:hypothetical protein
LNCVPEPVFKYIKLPVTVMLSGDEAIDIELVAINKPPFILRFPVRAPRVNGK